MSLSAGEDSSPPRSRVDSRTVFFGSAWGDVQTPVISRADVASTPDPGPVIIAEYDSTTVVPPDATVCRDAGEIVIRLRS
jgi:N-methylhydantoinase A